MVSIIACWKHEAGNPPMGLKGAGPASGLGGTAVNQGINNTNHQGQSGRRSHKADSRANIWGRLPARFIRLQTYQLANWIAAQAAMTRRAQKWYGTRT
jgi:hypothetical protein